MDVASKETDYANSKLKTSFSRKLVFEGNSV